MKALSPEEERLWIRQLQRHDERAFTRLVREFQGPIYNLVVRMMGGRREEALDVSQEVFVSVFRAIDNFRGDSKLSTWLYRIAVNHCRNRQKYLGRRLAERHEAIDDVRESRYGGGEAFGTSMSRPDREVEGREAERFLQRAIGALELEQREILVLRDIEGLSYQEIEEISGLPAGTVKSRLHRARQTLQRALEEWEASR